VGALERALDRRARCARGAPIWVTETGAQAPRADGSPQAYALRERAGCQALAAQLDRWDHDPRVRAAFQYSFRLDPAFPVGLAGPALKHVYWTYYLWRVWASGRKQAGEPGLWAGCA
jgi:hypothetical protein